MKIIKKGILSEAARNHPIVKNQLVVWTDLVEAADWKTPHDLKSQFGKADILGNRQVVFNIKGNDFRLVVKIDYEFKLVILEKFGTHSEYNTWNLK